MDNRTRVSVIIPCHNHSKYIYNSVESVVNQTYPCSIFILDDGSADDSYDKMTNLAKEFSNIRIYRNEEGTGPSSARNFLIKEAWDKTDVFMMLDADDSYFETKVEKSVETWLKDPNKIGIVYTDAIIYNEKYNTFIREYRESFSIDRLHQECIISNTPLVSKLALEVCGLYDENMRTAEDWDLWLKITARFLAFHIPEALHIYTVTGNNSSDIVNKDIWQKNWSLIGERLRSKWYIKRLGT